MIRAINELDRLLTVVDGVQYAGNVVCADGLLNQQKVGPIVFSDQYNSMVRPNLTFLSS